MLVDVAMATFDIDTLQYLYFYHGTPLHRLRKNKKNSRRLIFLIFLTPQKPSNSFIPHVPQKTMPKKNAKQILPNGGWLHGDESHGIPIRKRITN